MVINLNGVYGGRGATPVPASTVLRRQAQGAIRGQHPGVIKRIERVLRWMHRGYVQANAGDLASAVAYSALIALIPTLSPAMRTLPRPAVWRSVAPRVAVAA